MKPGLDEGVELGDLLFEADHPLRQASHHRGGRLLAGQRGVLGPGRLDDSLSECDGTFDLALRFFSQVSMRLTPLRRIAAGV
ncbi:hypothetical protein ACIBBB_24380 [Streptomyces sp. NPDC051217]|uniref:hypothetical protein n=1 Tax=Streptomyces sp. NPDC051217 TaxID=3365644 RepID=UPI0037B4DB3B